MVLYEDCYIGVLLYDDIAGKCAIPAKYKN